MKGNYNKIGTALPIGALIEHYTSDLNMNRIWFLSNNRLSILRFIGDRRIKEEECQPLWDYSLLATTKIGIVTLLFKLSSHYNFCQRFSITRIFSFLKLVWQIMHQSFFPNRNHCHNINGCSKSFFIVSIVSFSSHTC